MTKPQVKEEAKLSRIRHSLGEERERSGSLRDAQGLASDRWDANRGAFYEGVVPAFE